VKAEEKVADPVAYLRQALAEDAFAVFCQPICALVKPLAYPMAEALVRLREEETSLCPPGEFLPVLEHYGLMPDLDRWVVRKVLRHLSSGAHPAFSVNLSPQTLEDRSFPAFVAREIKGSGVPADRLLFEIDEPDALTQPGRAFASAIGGLGCGVIIDGLGRGADFVEPLKTPCVKFIKVCSSLTRQLLAEGPLNEELRALLQVTAGMGIKVIAECVEDRAALVALHKRGIRFAQGFGVYPPHPIEACAEMRHGA
jgi:EAL domain-containing protein (putative c-di-GMP-specific phosphodiesterase class I)